MVRRLVVVAVTAEGVKQGHGMRRRRGDHQPDMELGAIRESGAGVAAKGQATAYGKGRHDSNA